VMHSTDSSWGDVNVEMVRDRAREIRESISKIRSYAAQPDTDFFADERKLLTRRNHTPCCSDCLCL
jgi:hypothetical protein